ncbi:MAG TPA: YbaB/EbfC family nucleoid-associated protein [Acidothermaceae bacterium]|nr:YbaB/EbfC family nucleoid-associated protein [Acidothermaceae bacterium]
MTSGDLPSMQQLLQQASQMQQQLMQAQDDLARERVVGDAGGGLVSATVSGAGELVALRIDPSVADPEDTETLADLVLAAVRAATGRAAALQAAKLGPLTQGFGGLGQLGGLGELDDGGLGGLPGGLPGLGL